MATTYTQLSSDLQSYCSQGSGQPGTSGFQAEIPTFINNAELRIYRELDFLSTRSMNSSLSTSAGVKTVDFSAMSTSNYPMYPVVVQGISAVLPAGTRVPFEEVSLDFIDLYWPLPTAQSSPSFGTAKFAMRSDSIVVLAPTPNAVYQLEVTGTWRPLPMSATNQTTWLGNNLPDLLLAASMVEASAWMREFGAMSDDPKLALSWEGHYNALKASAMEEEQRRKGQGPGWAPFSPTPITNPRT